MKYLRRAAIGGGLVVAASLAIGGQSDKVPVERYLAHVSTDKPIYRGGEKVYIRGVVLGAGSHVPMPAGDSAPARIEIQGPNGNSVISGSSKILDSTAMFLWDIPTAQPGGEYTALISHPSMGETPAQRKFEIRAYRAPRLNSQIVFLRDGYGPGDRVTASLHVERAEGSFPAGARVSMTARVDGSETWQGAANIDSAGNALAGFTLPADIARGEGTITMTVEDGGVAETATKTIPILLRTLDVGIYPEGGDLVAGLETRVYFEAKTPAQKPADIAGSVVDASGKEVATFRTQHEGRGRFSFTPAKGERYSLRVTGPAGIKTAFPLPAVKESGVVISSTSDVTPKQQDIVARVASTASGAYRVSLSQYGKTLSVTPVKLNAGEPAKVTLTVPRSVDGALVVTVYDDQRGPVAERMIFRQPDRSVLVTVVPDRTDYIPGDKVTLRVRTTDDRGKPVGAVVGLTVTDSSVLEMIEKRHQAPRLPEMVLLENDVRNLSDAHIYLDPASPNAAIATDLLLGTQGWRRFATVDRTKWFTTNIGDATRAPGLTPDMIGEIRLVPDAGAPVMETPAERSLLSGGDPLKLITVMPGFRATPLARKCDRFGNFSGSTDVIAGLFVGSGGFRDGSVDGNCRRSRYVVVDNVKEEEKEREYAGREYAHQRGPFWTESSRADFAETVYWNAGIKTNDSSGAASVSFYLSDSVTSFRVTADAFTRTGALGSSVGSIESARPFFVEPRIPLEITSGDVIRLPVTFVNGTKRDLRDATITAKPTAGLQFTMPAGNGATLRAKESSRRIVAIEAGRNLRGAADVILDAQAGAYRDTVKHTLNIQPKGFPQQISMSGMLEANGSSSFEFTIPADLVQGTATSNVVLYPTPLANMTEALQALIRAPGGGFEPTSSISYPLVMAQQYFITHEDVAPEIIQKVKGLLDVGYERLTGFEAPGGGFEWRGVDPGNEALTAYALMQLTEMSRVRHVDDDLLKRTRDWLLSRRDGKGAFNHDATRARGAHGRAPEDTTNAYITWTLVESGQTGLENEIAHVKSLANSARDSYIVALGANILHGAGDRNGARQLMDKLAQAQARDGHVENAFASITPSVGESLDVETTALAVLAWMRESAYDANAEMGLRWIIQSNRDGLFGSTQSTVMALRAIIAHDAAHPGVKAPGQVFLTLDGKPAGAPMAFTHTRRGAMVMPSFGKDLGAGKHTVALTMEDGSRVPFSISVKYHNALPESAAQTKIGIQVALRDSEIQEGGITEAAVSIVNKSDEEISTPLAIVGIPAGLEVRHDQLKELVKSGRIDAYEVIGREVHLYWRYLKANDKLDLPVSLVAAVPGSYTSPASRAYLYYTDEFKSWAPPLNVIITPR